MQADYTLRRLQQLKETILGTESLVAIELDSRRNELVALNLVSEWLAKRVVCKGSTALLEAAHSSSSYPAFSDRGLKPVSRYAD